EPAGTVRRLVIERQLFRAGGRRGTWCARAGLGTPVSGVGERSAGPRSVRAATQTVEGVRLPGRPERLKVAATRRAVCKSGHGPIEPDVSLLCLSHLPCRDAIPPHHGPAVPWGDTGAAPT